MARDNLQNNIGIAWEPDPEPEVFEYLIYFKKPMAMMRNGLLILMRAMWLKTPWLMRQQRNGCSPMVNRMMRIMRWFRIR